MVGSRYIFNNAGVEFKGDAISCYHVCYDTMECSLYGNFISNNDISIGSIKNNLCSGLISNNNTNAAPPLSFEKRNFVFENCLMEGADKIEYEIYSNAGNFINTVSGDSHWQTPSSANDWILECIPNSYCDVYSTIKLSPLNPIGLHVESGSNTITYKIYPVGWTTALDNDDIVLEISYLDSASGVTRTIIINTTATYANSDWRSVSTTFTAGQDGIVYVQLYMRKYESGCYLLIDPVSVVS